MADRLDEGTLVKMEQRLRNAMAGTAARRFAALQDGLALLAEVRRLRAELESLREEGKHAAWDRDLSE